MALSNTATPIYYGQFAKLFFEVIFRCAERCPCR